MRRLTQSPRHGWADHCGHRLRLGERAVTEVTGPHVPLEIV
ncbi:hypothetical protein [Streptomyces justiciae]|uniref:Uncharacterized protein n=1 Tax=Streptomyces justiciae TaxID=2780140 RepID=A0ABU3LWD3_9ACTN|nr:hypothetical protein [Streptomyces justiciae]MDT7843475.1 hypothetical protein [Streptomyces justiciae]